MTPVETAQQILDGTWKHASAALQACKRGEWARFVREVAPMKPLLVGRIHHGRCLALAERSLSGPVTTALTLVPLWGCSTEDAVSNPWVAVHGVVEPGKPLQVREVGPFTEVADASARADALWACTVRRWTAAIVVESRAYAPEIPMRLRAGAFSVLEVEVDEVLSVDVQETEPLPRPTRELPMFAVGFEPRVRVSRALESQIRDMGFVVEDEGE